MTGPEHYKHAEQLLDWAGDSELGSHEERYQLAAAQVHATLALAAASANAEHYEGSIPLAERPTGWDAGKASDALTWSEVLR